MRCAETVPSLVQLARRQRGGRRADQCQEAPWVWSTRDASETEQNGVPWHPLPSEAKGLFRHCWGAWLSQRKRLGPDAPARSLGPCGLHRVCVVQSVPRSIQMEHTWPRWGEWHTWVGRGQGQDPQGQRGRDLTGVGSPEVGDRALLYGRSSGAKALALAPMNAAAGSNEKPAPRGRSRGSLLQLPWLPAAGSPGVRVLASKGTRVARAASPPTLQMTRGCGAGAPGSERSARTAAPPRLQVLAPTLASLLPSPAGLRLDPRPY